MTDTLGSFKIRSVGFATVAFDANDREFRKLFSRAPLITWRRMRDAVGGAFGSHRREWIARTKASLDSRRGIRAERLGSKDVPNGVSSFQDARRVYYAVFPKEKRLPPGTSPNAKLPDILGVTATHSKIAEGLEVGGSFKARSGRMIAIPIGVTLDSLGRPKSRWFRPDAFRAASARNELVALRFGTRLPKLYQVKGGGARKAAQTTGALSLIGDRPTGRARSGRRILLPAYQLVPRVNRRQLLRYMATWDELEGDRRRRFRAALDGVIEDIDRGLSS